VDGHYASGKQDNAQRSEAASCPQCMSQVQAQAQAQGQLQGQGQGQGQEYGKASNKVTVYQHHQKTRHNTSTHGPEYSHFHPHSHSHHYHNQNHNHNYSPANYRSQKKNRAMGHQGKSDLGQLVARDKRARSGPGATTEQRVNKWLMESAVAAALME
jgi:hypothetical protein